MSDNSKNTKYLELRKKHPEFVFNAFVVRELDDGIYMKFDFRVGDSIRFEPDLFIERKAAFNRLDKAELDTFAFHIGMVELVSYWKSCCSPKVIIKPAYLNATQILWWKHLYFQGLGEFFYLNAIPLDPDGFMDLSADSDTILPLVHVETENKALIPVGGGKDSVVTLELLKGRMEVLPLIMNPRKATIDTVLQAEMAADAFLKIQRTIHPKLLELNKQGYLNGHTPFSALLAFVTVFAAALTGSKYILLSNESSANESTVADSTVNHQYSKSFEFERDFRSYISRFVSKDIEYLSFLRPLSELQIAFLFSKLENHHFSFRSCNVGSKKDVWCGKCAKCLFTYIVLSPFIEPEKLNRIYGGDLYNDVTLLKEFKELTGLAETKPFECVGTIDEVHVAVVEASKRYYQAQKPFLIDFFEKSFIGVTHDFDSEMKHFDNEHFLNKDLLGTLKTALQDD